MTEAQGDSIVQTKPKYAMRTSKVLSRGNSESGFSTALVYKPDTIEEQKHGNLYFVIDINSVSPLTPDIAYNLIDIVKEEYYRDLAKSPAKSFEDALKAANEEFAAIAKEGEKSWIGKTNIVIAAVSGTKLLAVHRGTSELHLWRNGKMMQLSEGMYTPGETPRPEETLSNIIEGDLAVGDKLIISTAELFYYFSVEKLKRMIESYSPAGSANRIANQLEKESGISRTNLIIAEFSMPELIDSEDEEAPEDNWIGGGEKESISASTKIERSAPVINKTYEEEMEDEELDDAEDIPSFKSKATPTPKTSTPKVNYPKFNYTVPAGSWLGKAKEALAQPAVKNTGAVIWKYLKYAGLFIVAVVDLVFNFVSDWVDRIKKRPNGNYILLGVVAVLAGVVVFSSISLARGHSIRVSKKTATASLASAIQKRDAAKAAIIYQDTAKASTLLFEAYGLAEAATKQDSTKAAASSLLAELKTQLDEVSKVKRFSNPRTLVDFSALSSQLDNSGKNPAKVTINKVVEINGDVYSFDTELNKIYKYNSASNSAGIVNSLISNEKKLKLAATKDNELILYTNPAGIYSFTLTDNKLTGKSLDAGNWNNAADIVAYTDKLYLLDPDNNNIWKYKQIASGYTKIAPYFEDNSKIDLKGASSFAIDGDVYVLTNGTLKKYTSGQAVDYSLQNIPEYTGKLNKITDIFTNFSSNGLYILDSENSRVLVFDKTGKYTKQYVFAGLTGTNKLYVDESQKTMWVLAGTQVYKFEL